MRQERIDANSLELNEKVVSIKRVTKVCLLYTSDAADE